MIHNGLSSLQLIWKTNFWPSRLLGPTSEDMSGDQVDVRAKALLRKGPNQEGRASQHTTDPSTTTVRWPEPQWPGGHRGACGSFPKNLRQGKIGSSLKNPGPCFSCGQMGHLRQDCPLMECDIRWEVHPTRRAKVAWNPPPYGPGPCWAMAGHRLAKCSQFSVHDASLLGAQGTAHTISGVHRSCISGHWFS